MQIFYSGFTEPILVTLKIEYRLSRCKGVYAALQTSVLYMKRLSRIHYENTPIQICRKFHLKKTENIYIKILIFFHISAQNIDCGYALEPPCRGGSNEYPQSMVLSRNKKNNVYPWKPQFYYIKVGFKGVKFI